MSEATHNFSFAAHDGARLCVAVAARTRDELTKRIARAAQVADIIELRLDRLMRAEFEKVARELDSLVANSNRPLIITLRHQSQCEPAARIDGLQFDETERRAFWLDKFASLVNENPAREFYGDIEFDLVQNLAGEQTSPLDERFWSRIICSHHDFDAAPQRSFSDAPTNLETIYEAMRGAPARVLKIAVRAADATDCLPIFQLLARAENELKSEGRALIALAMDAAGLMTRTLSLSRGAFLTYAALEPEEATAPGQITARKMLELYRVKRINKETMIAGLVGSPVSHSLSPQMHNCAFAETKRDAVYLPFEARDVDEFFKRMVHPRTREMDWNLRGLSVTAPHKQAAMKRLDFVDEAAREIGAVNTIVAERDALHGYNTDAAGFLAPLEEFDDFKEMRGLRAAILGAGGAARACLWALKKRGADVFVFARDEKRSANLASEFGAQSATLDEKSCFRGFDLVVNATPLGSLGAKETETPALSEKLAGARLCYDLVYNPSETLFLREARRAGCWTLGGLQMLVAQAAAQFELWTNERAPVEAMRAAAEEALAQT